MPQATLSHRRIQQMVRTPMDRAQLAEALWSSKAQVERGEGDDLRVECTADRLDLLTEAGLGLYLQGALGETLGIPPIRPAPSATGVQLIVDPSVEPLRPALSALVVEPPSGTTLDAELLEEAIRFQELLHATFGLRRRIASLGIYPLARVRSPVHYRMETLDRIRFTPLAGDRPIDGKTFYDSDPMAAEFGAFGRDGDRALVLVDDAGTVLSLPPVLNSREAGEARTGDGTLLLESTGLRPARVEEALGLLGLVFVARGWAVSTVPIARSGTHETPPNPSTARWVKLTRPTLDGLAGQELPSDEVESLLGRSRLGHRRAPHGWDVEVPPWRPDLQTGTDLSEDVLLARGLRPEEGVIAPTRTRGRRSEAAKFRSQVGEILLGLGIVPLYTPVLVPARIVALTGRTETIALTNPVSDQFAYLRDSLFLALAGTLERNTRRSYPQQFSEVGPVVVASPGNEAGAETRYHAGVFLAGEGAGFSDAAALVDYVLRTLGITGVREPMEVPGTIAGRSASVRLTGEVVAEVGEVHPSLLSDLGVPVPVAWAELDLTALAPLLGVRRAP